MTFHDRRNHATSSVNHTLLAYTVTLYLLYINRLDAVVRLVA